MLQNWSCIQRVPVDQVPLLEYMHEQSQLYKRRSILGMDHLMVF
jgi:hypothetical protein